MSTNQQVTILRCSIAGSTRVFDDHLSKSDRSLDMDDKALLGRSITTLNKYKHQNLKNKLTPHSVNRVPHQRARLQKSKPSNPMACTHVRRVPYCNALVRRANLRLVKMKIMVTIVVAANDADKQG